MSRIYITTTIPYVNAEPHLGFALELVQADVLARHHRERGDDVRLLSGTDDNSLKNAIAAEAANTPVQEFVDGNADRFEALADHLDLRFDDFIRTSRDPRHRPGVERLWRACEASGDLYQATYEGFYCVGCEHYLPDDSPCPEHTTPPERVSERNWFFRLSRYADAIREAITSERLRITPKERRNEVLAFVEAGLRDFSISRSCARARGWGIPVPGDPDQVIYVWWDALGNYITALDYGADRTDSDDFTRWWIRSDRRMHLVGKGVVRFHAVYWPAMLLSAGLPLPTDVVVHDYLTADGRKISKSSGAVVDPAALAERYGKDAVRWWLLREVPRVGDTDFTVERLVTRADDDLAGGVGNLVNRVVTMVHRFREGRVSIVDTPTAGVAEAPAAGVAGAPAAGFAKAPAAGFAKAPTADVAKAPTAGVAEAPTAAVTKAPTAGVAEAPTAAVAKAVAEALDDLDFRRATAAVWSLVDDANRRIEAAKPWVIARDPLRAAELDHELGVLIGTCLTIGGQLRPFLPQAADRVAAQCTPVDGVLPAPVPLYQRLATVH